MPIVDTWTTLIFMTVLLVFQSGAWLGVDRLFPRLPGVRLWATASLISGLGALILCATLVFASPAGYTIGNIFQITGFCIAWGGIRQFSGRQPAWLACLVIISGSTLALVSLTLFSDSEINRTIIVASTEALIALLCSYELLRYKSPATGVTSRASALALIIQTCALLAWSGLLIAAPDIQPAGFSAILNSLRLIVVISTIFWNFGFLAMVVSNLQRRLEHLAATDELTGVANRRAFIEAANRERSRADRDETSPSLLIIDVDNFKGINDALGHVGGDQMLASIVRTIGGCLRPYDLLARIGGDEFCVLMPGTSYEHAEKAAERIRHAIEMRTLSWNGKNYNTTVSIGVVTWTPEMGGLLQIMSLADVALYDGKRTGRNRVVAVKPDIFDDTNKQQPSAQLHELVTTGCKN